MAKTPTIQEFLGDQSCIIVEPSQNFAAGIRACLRELGIPNGQVLVVSKFAAAKPLIEERRPKLLICEYEIDGLSGLELTEIQEGQHEEAARISFITSKNSSASAIADAAEGQVDGYLLKPFTIETFRQRMMEILERKMNPSEYLKTILLGKSLMRSGEIDKAVAAFQSAKALQKNYALACFYAGVALQAKGDIDGAIKNFREGRTVHPLHYKCMAAEFEALMLKGQFDAAYELSIPMRKHFPVTPVRLKQMLDLCMTLSRYDEMPEYFRLYRSLDERGAELGLTAAEAFFRAGVHSIGSTDLVKAFEHFETGLQITGREFAYLEKVISEFLKQNALQEAQSFLTKVAPGDIGSPAYIGVSFRVEQRTLTKDQLINKGRQIVFAGHGTPEIFDALVRALAEAGKDTLAESIISKAVESFPDMRGPLYKALEEHSRAS